MGTEIEKRLRWVQLAEQGRSCTQVCLQCGISQPTLRKWVERYRTGGLDGLLAKVGDRIVRQPKRYSRRNEHGSLSSGSAASDLGEFKAS